MSTNIYWMYENKLEQASQLLWITGGVWGNGVISGGTANLYDYNLETASVGSAARGTHSLVIYFDGTGIRCNSAVFATKTPLIGTLMVYWGTTLGGQWGGPASARLHPRGTTLITWVGTVVYVKRFQLRWQLDVRNDITANEIFLGKRLELSSNPVYPLGKDEHKSVTKGETPKGIQHSYHNFDRKSWHLQYEGITDVDKESIEEMVNHCHGQYKPLWFTLNPDSPEETEFVRFSTDRFTYEEIISGYWRVNLSLEQEL